MTVRRKSKPIRVGDVTVGGDAPVSVQSMTNTDTRDATATIEQIARLEEAGCEIIRAAVPDVAAVEALSAIKRAIRIPLVADIHFDYRLALASLKAGVDGLRLNPGNIRDAENIRMVVRAAKGREVPIRIGVNAGSLPPLPPLKDGELPPTTAQRMVRAGLDEVRLLEDEGFDLIKLSLKAFDVPTTVEAYRTIADLVPYPLHLGITEAGTPRTGAIRSAVGIGTLLYMGIGDTIRVSLTADPVEEMEAGYEILKSLNLRQHGPVMVSCPSCGRCEIDLIGLANAVEERLKKLGKPIKVAVMGCVVNGPGEAREADFGIAGGKGRGVLFRGGEVLCTVEEKDFLDALMREIDKAS